MKNNNVIFLLLGLVVGAGLVYIWTSFADPSSEGSAEKKPLYWVAPMDANYRRDKPGKSPMGMDLIPVYEDDAQSGNDSGITISPNVVNNLGVRVAKVTLGELENNISTVGYIKYDENRLIHIHPRVTGWVEKLYVKTSGDPIEKNQPLYQIYSPELVNAQEELLIALQRKNRSLIQAAETRLTALNLPNETIQKIKTSKSVETYITVRSPQSGVVDNLNIREGFYVKPGTTLMSVGNLDNVWVEVEVFEQQVNWVSVGDTVTMTLGYVPGREWQGRVEYIYPTLDSKTRTVKLRLKFSNEDRVLKPNMFAEVMIHSKKDQKALLVPREAVIRTGKVDRVVLLTQDNHFSSVAIKLGRIGRDHIEVLEGLEEGEKVVTSAQFLIDSETNKTIDFTRMSSYSEKASGIVEYPKATVMGNVNSIDLNSRTVNISRGAIEKWGREPATLDFLFDESIDVSKLDITVGSHVIFTFEVRDDFVVVEIELHQMDLEQSDHNNHKEIH